MSTKPCSRPNSHVKLIMIALLVILSASVLGQTAKNGFKKPDSKRDDLSRKAVPDLTLDLNKRSLIVKLAGVVMRSYPLQAEDSLDATTDNHQEISGDSVQHHRIESVHLLAAAATIPELEMNIIMEETGLPIEKVQRYAPSELVLVTGEGVRISIKSDCPDARSYLLERGGDLIRRFWYALIGRDSIEISLTADDALSLWGVIRQGMEVTIIRASLPENGGS